MIDTYRCIRLGIAHLEAYICRDAPAPIFRLSVIPIKRSELPVKRDLLTLQEPLTDPGVFNAPECIAVIYASYNFWTSVRSDV